MAYSKEVDKKWQKKWKEEGLYKFDNKELKNKFYTLEMFSYPSGANLHLGHWFNFAPADSYARFKSMKGCNVFHPMGFDAFGLPAENYAIKTGVHPHDSTLKNIETMKKQLEELGGMYDWDYSVETCMPDYYKWTEWIFCKLYEAGLAYKKAAPVNWCSSCNTVLANEQVVDACCERCGTVVERKKLEQWFFKTTNYAEELLQDLDKLDWPEPTKKIQRNWIGKSTGSEMTFKGEIMDLTVFTTRIDTLNGVTYVVIAPESDIALELTTSSQKEAVMKYREESSKISEIDRMAVDREKTGVFTGSYVVNPINNEKVPVWLADYVIDGYGTGCVMAVPAHDERDYEFAKKYNLEIKWVIKPIDSELDESNPFVEDGILINSGKYDNLTSKEAREKITTDVGRKTTNYRLKDWLVSRQRYWGAPIPIINCKKCGEVVVPEKDLPVALPYNVEFKPDGESPLKKSEEFMNCKCPKCGMDAKREADTLDTFVCSSWYFLRYPDARNEKAAWDKELINKMLPVDMYVGGKEHAAMHLIYARFMTKALRDLGYLNFDEPFKKLVHQGMILGPDGNKMSKSKGNTVAPDEYVDKYGSDVFRLHLMFAFAYTDGGAWKDEGIKAITKYLSKIEELVNNVKEVPSNTDLNVIKHSTIKAMTIDIEQFGFNTAIARSMEFLNAMSKSEADKDSIETLIKLISPLAPHFAEEMWEKLGYTTSVHREKWPEYDEKAMQTDEIEIPVQINGKVKAVIKVPRDANDETVKEAVIKNEAISEALKDKNIIKEIYVKGKIYNIVIK